MTDTTTRHGDRPEDQDGIAYYEYIGSAEGLRAEEAGTYSEYDAEAFDEMNREAWPPSYCRPSVHAAWTERVRNAPPCEVCGATHAMGTCSDA